MRGDTSKRTLGIALVTLLLVGYAGAGVGVSTDHTDGEDGDANVRVAHMSPDAPPVDVLVDGETAVENLSFGNVTEYLAVPAGERNVTIQAAGDPSTVVFSGNVTFEADTNYTVAATGEISENATTEFEPVVLEDDFTVPEENASVRLFHASPDAPPVDVTVEGTNTTLFDNVSFRNATDYVEVPAGDYTLEVRPATENDSGEVVATFDVTLDERTVYTAFAAGYLNPEDAPADVPFQLFLAIDATAEEKMTTTAKMTEKPRETTTTEKPVKETTTTEKPMKETTTTTEKPAKKTTTTTEKPRKKTTTTTEKPVKETTTTEKPAKKTTTTEKPRKKTTTEEKPRKTTTTTEKPVKETTTTTEKPRKKTTTPKEEKETTTTTEKPRKTTTTTEKPVKETTPKEEPRKKTATTEKPVKKTTTPKEDKKTTTPKKDHAHEDEKTTKKDHTHEK